MPLSEIDASAPVRVLVVDDSVVVRKLVSETLDAHPDIDVVGIAPNGRIALAKVRQLGPDLLVLDVEMPVMDGLETLQHLRRDHPDLPVVMFSSLTEHGARATLAAIEQGATDHVAKPTDLGDIAAARAAVHQKLVPKVLTLGRHRALGSAPVERAVRTRRPRTGRPVELVVIGSSTGGPEALGRLLPDLPADLPAPVLITQHMPPVFTRQFAERLDAKAALRVSEAVDGDALEAGRVLVAPGDFHMRVAGSVTRRCVVLDQGPPENFCRPAVDPLLRSAAAAYGPGVLAVILTGMGSDGALGAVEVTRHGGTVLVQDEESSVVWGMPGAVSATGTAAEVLPLTRLAAAITTRCLAGRSSRVTSTPNRQEVRT